MNGTLIKVALIVITIAALAGAKYFFHLSDDSKIQQIGLSLIDQEAESLAQDMKDDFEEIDLR